MPFEEICATTPLSESDEVKEVELREECTKWLKEEAEQHLLVLKKYFGRRHTP